MFSVISLNAIFGQAVESMVRKLKLKSPVIIMEDSEKSQAVSKLLREPADLGPDFCSVRTIVTLTDPGHLGELAKYSK